MELFSGGEALAHGFAAWGGLTYALTGSVRSDGWRLRLTSGSNEHRYSNIFAIEQTNAAPFHDRVRRRLRTTFAEALAGYQSQLGATTVKIFAGLGFAERRSELISQPHPQNQYPDAIGAGDRWLRDLDASPFPVGAVEVWMNLSDRHYLQLDAAASGRARDDDLRCRATDLACTRQDHDRYTVKVLARWGWRLDQRLSLGPEAAASLDTVDQVDRDADGDLEAVRPLLRGGLFARYDWGGGEAVVSGGASGDEADRVRGYAHVNVLLRY